MRYFKDKPSIKFNTPYMTETQEVYFLPENLPETVEINGLRAERFYTRGTPVGDEKKDAKKERSLDDTLSESLFYH